ncbi:MAG TPA: XRE family transcriptional regulator [Ignavibacteria bacterium]|nr:XRE family transcriptional regulator [Ignavibacteria bacterium]
MSNEMKAIEMKIFGAHLRELREESRMTLKEVSKIIGIDISLLAKIERSERQPTKEFIKKIAVLFKVDENELIIEFLSDQIAYKILDEKADLNILKVAENKVSYLKSINNE